MKIAGVDLQAPVEEILVLPRGETNVVFKARPVLSMEHYEKSCPEPKPPGKRIKGGAFVPNLDDAEYKRQLTLHNELWLAYMVLKSLEATDGLEWEKVNIDRPLTWPLYRQELLDANFSQIEINRITALVLSANCLDEKKLEEARKSFILGQGKEVEKSSGPSTEPETSPSGNLACALA